VKTKIFLSLLLSLALLQGCGGKGSSGSSSVTNGSARLVNAALAYPSLDMTVPGTTLASAVASGSASTAVAITPATYAVSLVATGSGNPLLQQSLTIYSGVPYALVAHTEGGQLKLTALTENEVAPTAGDGKIRLSNLALQDTGGVDVYMAGTGGTLASASAMVTNLGVASGYFEIPQGTYQIWVTGVGNKADVRLYLSSVVISNQQIATLALTATGGGVLVDGWLVTQGAAVSAQTNTSARIRVAANIAAMGTVVATVNGVALDASTLVSPALDSYALVPSGALTTSVVVGGTAVNVPNLTAAAGADYTLLAAGTVAAPTFFLLGDDNTLPLGGRAKLRLVNGVNGFAGKLLLTADANLVAQNVAFGAASTATSLATTGNVSTLQVTPPFVPALTLPGLTLQSQGVYSVFVVGGTTAPDVPTAIVRADR
jgi:hypothetical protein